MVGKKVSVVDRIRARQNAAREKRNRIVRCPTELPKAERILDMVADSRLRWYALLIVPQKEYVAQEILARRGIVTYCPSDFRWRRRNRFTVDKDLRSFPLVPGYVFAGLPVGVEPWHDVFDLGVVRAVVGIDGRPFALPKPAMSTMVSKFRNGFVRPEEERFMRTNREYKVGDEVRITDGPLTGFGAKVVEIEGAVARVMFTLFGITRPVPVSTEALEPLEPAA